MLPLYYAAPLIPTITFLCFVLFSGSSRLFDRGGDLRPVLAVQALLREVLARPGLRRPEWSGPYRGSGLAVQAASRFRSPRSGLSRRCHEYSGLF